MTDAYGFGKQGYGLGEGIGYAKEGWDGFHDDGIGMGAEGIGLGTESRKQAILVANNLLDWLELALSSWSDFLNSKQDGVGIA